MFIFKDEDVLDPNFRVKIIREIMGEENLRRKVQSVKRYEMFRDKTVDHVMNRLRDQGFLKDTIDQMRARASNISILKKIVKKKARSYVSGVDRKAVDKAGKDLPDVTKSVEKLAEILKVTQVFRRADEARELNRNALIYCHPIPTAQVQTPDGVMNRWTMTTRVLQAHQFDAIPSAHNRELAGCIILSDYPAGLQAMMQGRGALGYRSPPEGGSGGDGRDQEIANSRSDAGAGDRPGDVKFIWWTSSYHFTTDKDGKIVAGQQAMDLTNPIKRMPFVHVAKEQDGEFWADGGDDLSEGAILINLLLTDFAGIMSAQGWGQPVLIEEAASGQDQPEEVETGPHNLIRLRVKQGSSITPDYKLVSTDPHPDAWLRLIEVYVALLLTTNNLSPRNISGKLDVANLASGVAKMIDESESTEDITEAQAYFSCKEEEFWDVVQAWLAVLTPTDRLDDELAEITGIPADVEINTRFKQAGAVLSEDEKLSLILKKKQIGLTLFQDLLKLENPNLSDEEALELLGKIIEQRLSIQKQDPTLLSGAVSATIREMAGPDGAEVAGGSAPNGTDTGITPPKPGGNPVPPKGKVPPKGSAK